jgi:hypothetical protein
LTATWARTPERLFHAGDDSGHVGERFADLVQHGFSAVFTIRAQCGDEFGGAYGHSVLVEFGAARFANERFQGVDLLEPGFDLLGHLARRGQRGARRKEHVDLDGAFVEGREKVVFQLDECYGTNGCGERRQPENR